MKIITKRFITSLLCIVSLSAVLCGCSESSSNTENPISKAKETICVQTTLDLSAEPFIADSSKYNIDLAAEYNAEENTVDTTLTNNTGDLYVFQDSMHSFYKQNGDSWEDVTFIYEDRYSSEAISPKNGENIYNYSFCAYPNFSRSSSIDVRQARKTKYFSPGKYKVAVKVSVCDPMEYAEVNNDDKTETIPLYDNNLVTFLKEAYFTVE
ncbi:hypothetical protein [Ruminococcus sp.]|uniref:hypothetical protein n=1 Tax=Ruminococcus sp. TaxID=41978 RepID=UPI003F0D473B